MTALQLNSPLSSKLLNLFAGGKRPCEGYFVDIHVARKHSSCLPVSGEDIDHTRWEPGLFDQVAKLEQCNWALL